MKQSQNQNPAPSISRDQRLDPKAPLYRKIPSGVIKKTQMDWGQEEQEFLAATKKAPQKPGPSRAT